MKLSRACRGTRVPLTLVSQAGNLELLIIHFLLEQILLQLARIMSAGQIPKKIRSLIYISVRNNSM